MNMLEEFLQKKIGIDIQNSNSGEVEALSDIIKSCFPEAIKFQEDDAIESLYEYWDECKCDWEVMFIENDDTLNALRYESAENYKETHLVLTASAILEDYLKSNNAYKEIEEDELTQLFGE